VLKVFASALSVLVIAVGTQANAQGQPGGTYFCSSEIEAGLKYDPSLKEWRSVRFKEKEKFVLKLRFVRAEEGLQGGEIYSLTITPEGRERADECYAKNYGLPGDPRELSAHADYRNLFCYTTYRTYQFNMKTSRFLSAYIEGYVDGDKNGDTPAFAAGKCTKINQ
jgi:hypothetical protein